MTLSLVAHDPQTDELGVGVLTAMVGVGKLVPYLRPGVGAAVTQAHINPYAALGGLDLVERGVPCDEALRRTLEPDPGAPVRQIAIVDRCGGAAAWTGDRPDEWKGHRTGAHRGGAWSCQGNRLAGPEVVDAMVASFTEDTELPLVERLLGALRAGVDAGGDTKGHLAANVVVVGREVYPTWDLRVDHAEDPLAVLHALYDITAERLAPQIAKMPTRDDPTGGIPLEELIGSG